MWYFFQDSFINRKFKRIKCIRNIYIVLNCKYINSLFKQYNASILNEGMNFFKKIHFLVLYKIMAISERCSYDVIIIKGIVFIVCNVIIFIYVNLFYCYIVLCYVVRISTNWQDIDLNRVNET